MKLKVILGAVLVGVAILGIACSGGGAAAKKSPAAPPAAAPVLVGNNVTVILHEAPYRFDPKVISLEHGKAYAIKVVGGKEPHTFTSADLKIDQIVNAGQTVTIKFTPQKAGTFKLVCLPHESQGMIGTFEVK